jgi:hypothetical protein
MSMREKLWSVSLMTDYPNSLLFPVRGNCLDSDKCSMRVKDGDCVLAHEIERTPAELLKHLGEVVIIETKGNGPMFVKVLSSVLQEVQHHTLTDVGVMLYVPQPRKFYIRADKIGHIYAAEKVLTGEYVSAHKYMEND